MNYDAKAAYELAAKSGELVETMHKIKNLAHLAWESPETVRGAFERIETLANEAIAKATKVTIKIPPPGEVQQRLAEVLHEERILRGQLRVSVRAHATAE